MKKSLFLLLKIIVLLVITLWLSRIVDFNKTWEILNKATLSYLIIAFIINNLTNLFITIKWYRLAKPLKLNSDFIELLKLNYIAIFYSIFIPGQASGELIKGIKLQKKEEGHPEKVWAPIFIDKITNLLVILIIGTIAVLFDTNFNENKLLLTSAVILTVLLLIFSFILFTEKINFFLGVIKDLTIKTLKIFKIKFKSLENFSLNYFNEYKEHKLIIVETFFWSLMTKVPHIFALYYIGKSLGIDIPLIEASWLFSIISIATLLPISFSGLGVREGAAIFFMSKIGIESSQALSCSVIIFFLGVLTGLIGGVIELTSLFNKENANIKK